MPLPFQLDHINLWLLEDGEGWTILDTGYSRDEVRDLWEQHFTGVMAGRPTHRVIATHCHPDHVGMAEWLTERFGCELWMTEAEYLMANLGRNDIGIGDIEARVAFFRQHGLRNGRSKSLAARGNYYRRGVPGLPGHFHRIFAGQTVTINGREWEAIIAHGHSPEHAAFYCRELNVLISGDQILPRITPNVSVWHIEPDANPIKRYLDSLEQFRRLPEDVLVCPAHGRVFSGLHYRIDVLIEHHEARLREVAEACEEPKCAADLLEVIFRRELDSHQLSFAMGEAIAHLNYLKEEGALSREMDDDGVYRFRLIR
ncbi:MAG: MBL fold metallo-hydrolase [Gammaproteobacteria bacterium]